jgi:ribosomal protein L11 methyltransferase
MREGLVPSAITHVMRLATNRETATALSSRLGEMLDADENAVASFEEPDGKSWLVEVFFSRDPEQEAIRSLIRLALPGSSGEIAATQAFFEPLMQKDWIAASLEGLKPVRAGRFIVHGSHDRAAVRPNDIPIEIEAALAFGTGHHGTTLGCLQLFNRELKRKPPRRVLDVGTGTGVLAIAAALATRQFVASGDIDPISTITARENARSNRARAYIRPVTARGVMHPDLQSTKPYDLIFANILAKPLRLLAPTLAGVASPGARLILSGLLIHDVPGVLTAYRAQGYALVEQTYIEGWSALLLRRGGAAARPL